MTVRAAGPRLTPDEYVDAIVQVAERDASIGRMLREILSLDGAVRSSALDLVAARAQRGIDREDLGVGHVAHHARLRDVLTGRRQGHVDVEDRRRPGV